MSTDNEDPYYSFNEEENQKESEEDLGSLTDDAIRQAVVTSTDWTTETILNQIEKGNILLNPKFQRREAWNEKRKSKFIESLMLGLPIPQLVLAASKDQRGKYLVLDGKQRLISIRKFAALMDDKDFEQLKLSGLEIRKDMNGKCLYDLQNEISFTDDLSFFENQPIRTIIVKNWPNETFLFNVFLRLNTGSVSLSPQELRQALHPGPFVDFADDKSSVSPALRNILKKQEPDFRMRDAELLIRYYAFLYFFQDYKGNLKTFLDTVCKTLNEEWDTREHQIQQDLEKFEEAHKAIIDVFAKDAYRKWTPVGFESRFNRAIFDILIFTFQKPNVRDVLIEKGSEVKKIFIDLCENDAEFLSSIEQTTKSTTATYTRFSRWCDKLKEAFNLEIRVPYIE